MTDFLQILLEISAYAAVMVLAVLAIRALFARKISPRVISVLWLLVLLRLCVPFTLESPVHLSDLLPAPPVAVQADHTSNDISAASSGYAVIAPDKSTSLTIPGTQPAPANPSLPTAAAPAPSVLDIIGFWIKSLSLRDALAVLWGLGALAVLMTAVIQTRRFKRRIVGHGTAAPSAAVRIAESHRQSLHIRRRIRVLECDGVCAPMVFGFFRPYILLPAGFSAGIAPGRLSCILLHEVCHIKRRDILFGYIWLLAKAAHWFNPLVWLAYRLMSDDTELCCDRMVTHRLSEQQSFEYTQSLIDVFSLINKKATLPAAASFCENRSRLSERVMRLLDPPKTSRPVMALTLTITLILTAACFTTACTLTAQPADSVDMSPPSPSPVAAAEPSAAPAAESATAPVQEQDSIPDVWQEDILNADGEPFMRIDAPVTVPEADKFPVLEVAAAPLSQQQVSALTAYFSQGQTLTNLGDSRSVGEIQSQLAYLNSLLDDSETTDEYPTAEDIQSEIDSYKLMLEEESKIKHETVDSALTESPNHSGVRLHVSFDLGGDYPAEIVAAVDGNNSCFVFNTNIHMLFRPFSEPALYSDKLNLTAEMAASQTKELLTVLGFNDFEVVSVQRGAVPNQSNKQGYIVTCRQIASGIPVVYTSQAGYRRLTFNEDTGRMTDPDTGEAVELLTVIAGEITVQLDDTGVVSFQCHNTLKPGAVTEDSPALMDFSEIQRLFKEQTSQIYSDENRTNDTTCKITSVSLAYSTIWHDDDSFHLIPAWIFTGCYVDANGTNYIPSAGVTSLMAYSAIDGTRLGYSSPG